MEKERFTRFLTFTLLSIALFTLFYFVYVH